jgi:hypothetical protein
MPPETPKPAVMPPETLTAEWRTFHEKLARPAPRSMPAASSRVRRAIQAKTGDEVIDRAKRMPNPAVRRREAAIELRQLFELEGFGESEPQTVPGDRRYQDVIAARLVADITLWHLPPSTHDRESP